jgi:H+-transporting ATPase
VNDAKWEMLCLLPMFDPPRHDTRDTIHHCRDQGVTSGMWKSDWV